jgi:hypothetical protein
MVDFPLRELREADFGESSKKPGKKPDIQYFPRLADA